jgi:hypothetical protein
MSLLADLNYFGLLFESMVIRDMRIYAEANSGNIFQYRDSKGVEVDCIVEYPDLKRYLQELKGSSTADYRQYEIAKSFLNKFPLTAIEYEGSIKYISERLNI